MRPTKETPLVSTESVRKPEIMDVDDKYGAYFDNVPKMKAYYRDAAIPDGFTPQVSAAAIHGFPVSHAHNSTQTETRDRRHVVGLPRRVGQNHGNSAPKDLEEVGGVHY